MYESIPFDILVYYMLYGGAAIIAAVACLHLLMWRINPFVDNVTPPKRLRRWTAAFMAVVLGSHLWWLPDSLGIIKIYSGLHIISAILDCALLIPVMLSMPLTMLQDRRRPLWPLFVVVIPAVIALVACLFKYDYTVMVFVRFYLFALLTAYFFYMLFALRQYRRWLIDNYADLEHKEVWLSLLVLAVIMFLFVYYVTGYGSITYEYIIQVSGLLLIGHLLWRVETLQNLNLPISSENIVVADATPIDDSDAMDTMIATEETEEADASLSVRNNIGPLLRQHCEEPQLYLQYDLTLTQLATLIGVNRSYLSKHFALQGITYNAYINDLRIRHFVSLCQERAAAHQPLSIQQLALDSGFRSYSTFNGAFKQVMHTTATEWLRLLAE